MTISATLDRLHYRVRSNRWLYYFAIFNRVALAVAFLFAGWVKVAGERFTALSNNQPMGHYLEALYHTGYYYTFIGVLQMLAAVLLLIPRTATLGALIYFPIILNICVLSFAVRFDGSALTAPLMVLANLYLLCWDYHKLKFLLPFRESATHLLPSREEFIHRFPAAFFGGVAATVLAVFLYVTFLMNYQLRPRNTFRECNSQCPDSSDPAACVEFCDCIHKEGRPLHECLQVYERVVGETF